MGPVYEHFDFQIDDMVQLQVHCGEPTRKMQIVERLYVECPGGVQLFYSVVQSGHTPQKFLENTLEPYAQTQHEITEAGWRERKVKEVLDFVTKPPAE